MAFRVLSEKELALLSEKERQIYETEYKEYSERKAFVERLEYLDGVKFPKVKPKKPSIKRIKSPDISVKMNEPFRAVQPESLRDGKLFSRTSGKQFTPPVIGDAKVTGIPAVTLPKAEKRRNVEEYRLKPFTAFDFSRASKQNETVLHDVSAAHISEAKVSALPGVSIVSAAGVSADIPEYSVTEPVKVQVCDAGGFGAVSIPDAEVKLPAGVVVPSDGISVKERAVPDYKCTEMPEIRIAEASVSKVETGGQFKAEVPGVVTAKADVSNVRTGGQYKAEVPGVVTAKADVSNVRTGGQFKAEVPGTFVAEVPKIDFKLPKVRKKKAVTAVQPEAPAISCEIKEYVPEPVKEITVPVVGELPQLNSETNIDTKQPFVAKPVQINVKIDLPVQKAAEVKPFIAKADVPDGSETIRTILGLLR